MKNHDEAAEPGRADERISTECVSNSASIEALDFLLDPLSVLHS